MKSIQVSESSSFYKNSVNGADAHQPHQNFTDEVIWAEQNAIQIERYTIEKQPMAFTNNQIVKDFIERSGRDALPLILINGELFLSGRYPSQVELSSWALLLQPNFEIKPSSGCCSGGKCG